VNSIWLRSWLDGEEAIQALLSGEVDVMDSDVPPEYLAELLEAENVDVGHRLRNGYGYLSINTRKNPFNCTAFRRALAFALDKRAISEQVSAGMSEPLDSCVPKVNPFSVEGKLPYCYYDANAPLGNEILDAAGFLDVDNDTFRESPHGDQFDVLIECASSSDTAIQIGEECAQALRALHVNAMSAAVDFYAYLNRCYLHGDYDIVFVSNSFSDFDVDWLAYEFWGEYANQPYYNFPSWANQSYDQWRNQLLHSIDYDEVYEAAIEM
jgi:ABC-type transport system substrate-binding protein